MVKNCIPDSIFLFVFLYTVYNVLSSSHQPYVNLCYHRTFAKKSYLLYHSRWILYPVIRPIFSFQNTVYTKDSNISKDKLGTMAAATNVLVKMHQTTFTDVLQGSPWCFWFPLFDMTLPVSQNTCIPKPLKRCFVPRQANACGGNDNLFKCVYTVY